MIKLKKSERRQYISLIFLFIAVLIADNSNAMSLDEYLNQVRSSSLQYQSQEEQARGATLKSREADLYFTPQLFADARWGEDGKINIGSTFQYDRILMQNYSLGVSQEFRFGLQAKLSYAMDRMQIEGASGLPSGTSNTFWMATPKLEISLPLWGGAWGQTSEANETLAREQNLAAQYGSEAQIRTVVVQAEGAYWRLASAQEVVEVQKRAAQQAQSILDYVSRKARMNLGENADVLQARALVEATKFQLQNAQNSLRSAQRNFNSYLNKEANAVAPQLTAMSFEQISKLEIPAQRPGDRADIKAAESQARVAEASAQVTVERNKPKLDLYGSHAMNGFQPGFDESLNDAYTNGRDTTFVGVRFNMPLNLNAMGDAKTGALKAQRAAQLNFEHQRYMQELDWENLTQQLSEAKESLRLTENIVKAQKAKLDNERKRLRQGRTTTYQVLMFEQEFSQSEVNRVQVAAQIQALNSQIKLYQMQNEGGK